MAAYIRAQPSAPLLLPRGLLQDRIIPRQKLSYTALFVAVYDIGECSSQIGQWIDSIKFARFDLRGDSDPALGSGIIVRKDRVLPIKGYRSDGLLDCVVVHLNAAVGQEELRAIPVFDDVGQSLAEWVLGRDHDLHPVGRRNHVAAAKTRALAQIGAATHLPQDGL